MALCLLVLGAQTLSAIGSTSWRREARSPRLSFRPESSSPRPDKRSANATTNGSNNTTSVWILESNYDGSNFFEHVGFRLVKRLNVDYCLLTQPVRILHRE